jgi:quinoprotein glucose dehydrogenase
MKRAVWAGLIACLACEIASAGQTSSVWTGVYTKEQAARGQSAYRDHCSYCHHDDLLGGEDLEVVPPALVAAEFEERFYGRSVGELYQRIAETMPWRAKSLTPPVYIDIVSFLLKENGFPAGATELPPNQQQLDQILITAKPK